MTALRLLLAQVKFGAVDCQAHGDECEKMEVNIYPTLFLHHGNNPAVRLQPRRTGAGGQ